MGTDDHSENIEFYGFLYRGFAAVYEVRSTEFILLTKLDRLEIESVDSLEESGGKKTKAAVLRNLAVIKMGIGSRACGVGKLSTEHAFRKKSLVLD